MSSVHENLIAAKALIDTPEKWIKEHYVLEGCRCASGAVRFVESGGDEFGPLGEAHAAMRMVLPAGFPSIPDFNDHPDTTHADIMALFDRAIAATAPSGEAP